MFEFFKKILVLIKKAKFYIVIAIIFYIIGCILALILNKQGDEILLYDNVLNNYLVVFDKEISLFSFSFKRLFAYLGVGILVFLSSLTIWLIPINCLIFLYQGYILISSFSAFLSAFALSGVLLFFFVALPCSVLRFLGFNLLQSLNYNLLCECKSFKNRQYLSNILVAFMFIVIAFIWELIVIGIILRPLNFFI